MKTLKTKESVEHRKSDTGMQLGRPADTVKEQKSKEKTEKK